jgi:hypothetical protein
MRVRRIEQVMLRGFMAAACLAFGLAAFAAVAQAQNAPYSLTLPQSSEVPVSPTTPGTLPGTTAQDTAVGTNPITGAPCLGGGASAINGGIAGAPTAPDQEAEPGAQVNGLPPATSIYGLNNELPTTDPGAC